ncbi:MAG TPA: CDP-alcohol phosphatidyltransferase family protein [Candidatus Elarobacter sp.]|jgi:phosphatidylglycerophosphate synthase
MLQRVPNALSISRIVLAPIALVLSLQLTFQTYIATICVVSVALLTDFLDGHLARRWKVASAFGYVLDGLGDRAMHLALLLAFMTRYGINPVLVWLIIFREMGVYAIRISRTDWLGGAMSARIATLIHVSFFRLWLGLFLVRDGFRVAAGTDTLSGTSFDVAQLTLLASTIVVSYYGLLLNLRRP